MLLCTITACLKFSGFKHVVYNCISNGIEYCFNDSGNIWIWCKEVNHGIGHTIFQSCNYPWEFIVHKIVEIRGKLFVVFV